MPSTTLLALAMLSLGDPPAPLDVASALETVMVEAIARARPSVVAITRERGDDPDRTTAIRGQSDRDAFLPRNRELVGGRANPPGERASPGDFSSGVIIGDAGEILTTYHSLRGAIRIWVRTEKRQEFEAEILAADPRSDLAVIVPREGQALDLARLRPMAVGDASGMRPGTFLIALGNSYNAGRDGKASASWGILSNTARKVHAPEAGMVGVRNQLFRYQPTLLQLDTKLNMGMSGGGVVNMKGELVGLTSAVADAVAYDIQAGYAVPIDRLGRRIVETLKQGKEVEYGFLGVALREEIPNCVSSVGPGTPADRANIVANDIIVAVGDRQLDEDDGLTMALALVTPGESVPLKLRRDGQIVETRVLVSKFPVYGQAIFTNRPKPWRGLRVDFTSVTGNEPLANMGHEGVGVLDVETGSQADAAGLKKGQYITEVDGRRIATPADFQKAVAEMGDKPVTLTTFSNDTLNRVTIKK